MWQLLNSDLRNLTTSHAPYEGTCNGDMKKAREALSGTTPLQSDWADGESKFYVSHEWTLKETFAKPVEFARSLVSTRQKQVDLAMEALSPNSRFPTPSDRTILSRKRFREPTPAVPSRKKRLLSGQTPEHTTGTGVRAYSFSLTAIVTTN